MCVNNLPKVATQYRTVLGTSSLYHCGEGWTGGHVEHLNTVTTTWPPFTGGQWSCWTLEHSDHHLTTLHWWSVVMLNTWTQWPHLTILHWWSVVMLNTWTQWPPLGHPSLVVSGYVEHSDHHLTTLHWWSVVMLNTWTQWPHLTTLQWWSVVMLNTWTQWPPLDHPSLACFIVFSLVVIFRLSSINFLSTFCHNSNFCPNFIQNCFFVQNAKFCNFVRFSSKAN